MAATYSGDPAASKRDFVRFQINDTTVASALLEDAEIDALISEASHYGSGDKWAAAADALSILSDRWNAKGQGVLEKQVDDLRVRFGMETVGADVVRERIAYLRRRAATEGNKSPRHFRVV